MSGRDQIQISFNWGCSLYSLSLYIHEFIMQQRASHWFYSIYNFDISKSVALILHPQHVHVYTRGANNTASVYHAYRRNIPLKNESALVPQSHFFFPNFLRFQARLFKLYPWTKRTTTRWNMYIYTNEKKWGIFW